MKDPSIMQQQLPVKTFIAQHFGTTLPEERALVVIEFRGESRRFDYYPEVTGSPACLQSTDAGPGVANPMHATLSLNDLVNSFRHVFGMRRNLRGVKIKERGAAWEALKSEAIVEIVR